MALYVQKFGGTSVGSLEKIAAVADKIIQAKQQGNDILVVVSAMSGETDKLITMAKQLQHIPEPREYAVLVSSGEQVSMSLLAMALIERGQPACSFSATQAGISTDNLHQKARIEHIDTRAIQQQLRQGNVVIVAGFQGMNDHGEITTLGRGGSDTTAVALAAALQADECQIFTDVGGVFTTDPRVVPAATRLEQVTFEEMLEMANQGARVLQIRAVELAGKYQVPLRVLSTFEPGEGTLISYEEGVRSAGEISGIAFNRHEAKFCLIGVPNKSGVAAQILAPISDANIDVDMIAQSEADDGEMTFSFTVHRDEYPLALKTLQQHLPSIGIRELTSDDSIAKLSLVGAGMRCQPGSANKMFDALAQHGIDVQIIATSEIKVSVILDETDLELGVRALHTAFGLDRQDVISGEPANGVTTGSAKTIQ